MAATTFETPTGPFTIWEDAGNIVGAAWGDRAESDKTPLLQTTQSQILEYYAGRRTEFDVPLQVAASDFQQSVCDAIFAIPFGQTRTYGELAKELGFSAQAIGQGCGGNPIPLLIPCHRVLASDGLGGFSGTFGIETKVALLKHEGAASLLI